MQDNELQINIVAVDEASEVIDTIAETIDEAVESIGAAGEELSNVLTPAEEAAIDASIAISDAYVETADSIVDSMNTAAKAVTEPFANITEEAGVAGAEAGQSWGLQFIEGSTEAMQAMNAEMATFMQQDFDPDAEQEGTTAGTAVGESFRQAFIQIMVGVAALDLVKNIVSDTATLQTSTAQLNSAIDGMGKTSGSTSTEVAYLNTEILTEEGILQKSTGTVTQNTAAHEKAQEAITKYKGELAALTGQTQLSTQQQQQAQETLDSLAQSFTKYGLNVTDVNTAMATMINSGMTVTQVQTAIQAAADLAAKSGGTLTDATKEVIQAFNGQGSSIQDTTIKMQDGVSGMTAVNDLQQQVAGSAALAASTGLGPFNVALADINATMSNQNGIATQAAGIATQVANVTNAFRTFSDEHPKWATAFEDIFAAMALVLTLNAGWVILGKALDGFFSTSLLIGIKDTAIAIGTTFMDSLYLAYTYITATIGPAMATFFGAMAAGGPWIVAAMALATAIGLIKNAFDQMDTASKNAADAANNTLNLINSPAWQNLMKTATGSQLATDQKIQANALSSSANGLAVSAETSGVNGLMNGFLSLLGLGPLAKMATGGVVNSPQLALIGEAGPEAVIPLSAFNGGSSLGGGGGGASGSINITVGSLTGVNTATARAFATQIGKMINQQIKLKIQA